MSETLLIFAIAVGITLLVLKLKRPELYAAITRTAKPMAASAGTGIVSGAKVVEHFVADKLAPYVSDKLHHFEAGVIAIPKASTTPVDPNVGTIQPTVSTFEDKIAAGALPAELPVNAAAALAKSREWAEYAQKLAAHEAARPVPPA